MKLRFLRQNEVDNLYGSVKANLSSYRDGDFSFLLTDSSHYFESNIEVPDTYVAGVKNPEGKLSQDVANSEYLYRTLAITPAQAREERLWTYLTHTDLLNYTRARWPIPADDNAAVNFIQSHFFARTNRQAERDNAVSRLWWLAQLCSRDVKRDLARSLEVLLHNSDVRASIIERPTLSRSPNVFNGILDLLEQSYADKRKLFTRVVFREFMKRLNDLGGYTLLDAFERQALNARLTQILKSELEVTEF